MWPQRTLVGAGLALVVIAAVDALRSSDHTPATSRTLESTTAVNRTRYRRCPGATSR